MNRPSQAVLFWVGIFTAALLLFSRGPGHLLAPEPWAEDGVKWIREAYADGWITLCWPAVGYLQTLSRLGGLFGVMLPFTAIPIFFALIAFAVQLAPVALLLSSRGAGLISSLPLRLLLAGYYIAEPNSAEVYVNLTNAMWHLALVAFLLIILPKPKTRFGLGLDIATLLLAGLSGPLVLFSAPLAWWEVVARRRQPDAPARVVYAAVLSLCALLQNWLVITQVAAGHRVGHLGATLNRLFHIIANQVVLGGTIGAANVNILEARQWWLHTLPPALCCLVAASLGVVAFVKGPPAYRQFAVLAALVLASALQSPMITKVMPQWDPMQYPGIGDRYYIIPMLAWFATLLVLAVRPWAWHAGSWLARFLIVLCLIGVVVDWRYLPYSPTGYQDAAKTFDRAPPGTVVTFPEDPTPWEFTLTKR